MMTDVPRKVTVTTRACGISSAPPSSDGLERRISKENLREGTETPRVDLLANTIDGARTANSLAF